MILEREMKVGQRRTHAGNGAPSSTDGRQPYRALPHPLI